MPPFKIGMAAVGLESLEFDVVSGLKLGNVGGVHHFLGTSLFVEYDGVREGEMV